MEWQWIVIGYLLAGIILAEGLLYSHKKEGTRCSLGEYLMTLLLIPAFMIFYIPIKVVLKLL